MNTRNFLLCFTAILSAAFAHAQDSIPQLTSSDSVVARSWIVSLGINIIDDSGDAFQDFTTIKDQWNAVPYPSRISAERYFGSGLGLALIGTYNRYKAGNTIDGVTIAEDIPYWAIDSRLSYDLNKLVGETGFFDPYVGVGLGYADANNLGRGTYNAVVGFRLWFSDAWGVDLNSSGKWSFGNEASNHIQHAAGVAYRFGIEKELTKRGEEKLALLEEQQRKADSLDAARRAEEEARAMAEQLEREREAARLAAAEKASQEREAARRKGISDAVDALGYIYFDFDSSYLNDPSRATLDQLTEILMQHDGVRIRLEAHTDSRGSDAYNLWLSERRAERARNYLVEQGISEIRLEMAAHGESQLLNECADGVWCSEAKHRENRRDQFTILDYGKAQEDSLATSFDKKP